ncbi:uncharacterized protein TRIADDRAFT_28704 [Trichoplax adhaerens]|uniref:C-CAP/cofactor C-like domain-containing protein n=1 Tax=Trichoplax adhaerens TaxID=10228 RepID=B3S3X9_TRIAD|nr:hypothetical protein TRIADDRAFT_28704 [Trichoplax adhaerens]EDV22547.1 hypothetical protein TRIADDRAFT_28704 [Trichoplax adhaerens]|eukprot:XP_002115091.1 hypothetical protein TRIADDRAFT_28704 [Trichoplax adhaerens]
MTKRLDRLQEKRQAKVDKQRQGKDDNVAVQDSVYEFSTRFQHEKRSIEEMLDQCSSMESKSIPDQLDSVAIAMEKLEKFVGDSSQFIPSFTLRQAQENLNKLRNHIETTREQYMPKKKFAFKSRKKVAASKPLLSSSTTATQDDTRKIIQAKDQDSMDTGALARRLCDYSNQENQTLEITTDEISSKDVKLSQLKNCTVRIQGYPSALQIDHLQNCTILSGPVSSSVFVDRCHDCKIVVACQQLRIHSSTDIHFYIGVTSRAIIEDCTRFMFTSYNWSYPSIEQHFTAANLDKNSLSSSAIDDFNWLRIDQPSPNWSVLPEEDKIQNWVG